MEERRCEKEKEGGEGGEGDKPVNKEHIEFVEYHSIDVKGRKTKSQFAGAKKEDENVWVVLEKVHGCNFSFICNGEHLGAARRTGLLDDHETFYGWQKVRDKYREAVFFLFRELSTKYAEDGEEEPLTVLSITIYGELFGGIYPHADVPDLGLLHCQKGVYYSNDIEFFAFDILIKAASKAQPSKIKKLWLNYRTAMKLFKKYNIFCAQPLKEGPFDECIKYDIKFNSTIPALLGLPELPQNQCEGIVVKSIEPTFTAQGKRHIFKAKNAQFQEVNPKVPLTLYEKQREAARANLEKIYDEVERYINDNRMDTLRSKIGEVTTERINEASEAYFADVMKDFIKDQEELWMSVSEEERERASRNTRSKVNSFVVSWVAQNSK